MTEEQKQLKEFNDKWEMHKVISEALANAHTQPAPETIKMFEKTDDKIEAINHKLDEQDSDHKLLKEKIENWITSDIKWKDEMTPILKTMQKQQNFFSVGGTAMKGFILIGAVISAIVGATHYIKNWIHN